MERRELPLKPCPPKESSTRKTPHAQCGYSRHGSVARTGTTKVSSTPQKSIQSHSAKDAAWLCPFEAWKCPYADHISRPIPPPAPPGICRFSMYQRTCSSVERPHMETCLGARDWEGTKHTLTTRFGGREATVFRMPRVRHASAFVRGSESMGGKWRTHSRTGMREPEMDGLLRRINEHHNFV
jgi:hypothetical protein